MQHRRHLSALSFFLSLAIIVVIFSVSRPIHATTITVNSTGDGSDATPGDGICETSMGNSTCTLRAAIQEVNATAGSSAITIAFNITGAGVHTITLGSALTHVTRTNVTIDGTSQSGTLCNDLWGGSAPVWEIVIDAASITNGGLAFDSSADHGTVKGLEVKNVAGNSADAYGIHFNFSNNGTAQCNYSHNNWGGIMAQSNSNQIGGTSAGQGNLTNNNAGFGISAYGNSNTIQGNFSGTDATGLVAAPNASNGIYVENGDGNIVGGTAAGAHNLISGGGGDGVFVKDGMTNTTVLGNYIGVGRDGTTPLGNASNGIHDKGVGTIIGDGTSAGRNIISANATGVDIGGVGGSTVQGNYIGTTSSGNTTSSSLKNGIGIMLEAGGNTIGGTSVGQGNVIGGAQYTGFGPELGGGIVTLTTGSNIIEGNNIGVGADGTSSIPNRYGVLLLGSSSVNNVIGGTVAGAGNIIANNIITGVALAGDPGFSIGAVGTGNSMLGNSIYNNGFGIDLSANPTALTDGVTLDDALDADTGPNNLQNFPVLSTATAGGSTSVSGTLNAEASQTYRIEFFANQTADSSTYGQGKTYLDATTVTTNSSGNASFTVSLPLTTIGTFISATASKDVGSGHYSTSEFSQDVPVTAPPAASTGGDGDSYIVGLNIGLPSTNTSTSDTGNHPPTLEVPVTNTDNSTPPSDQGSESNTTPPAPESIPSLSSIPPPTRDLTVEHATLGLFQKVFGALPTTPTDWNIFTLFTYYDLGRPLELLRNLNQEQQGLAWFVHRFFRLPASSLDWRAINAWGYGQR